MAKLYTQEATGAYGVTPPTKAPASVVQTPIKRIRGVYVSTGANNAAGDTIVIGRLPIGAVFDHGRINPSVSSNTTTIAIGTAATPAKYKAAATVTTPDSPNGYGLAAQVSAQPLAAEEEVIATLGVAALPAGTYVFDLYYSSVAS